METNDRNQVVDYSQVPAGTYRCRVSEVRLGTTRAGDVRWSLCLVVVDGPCAGKMAAWDSLVFTTRGRARARRVLQALGLPSTGRVEIEPKDLEGREAMVEVRRVRYQGLSEPAVCRNEVPYDGYRPVASAEGAS